MSNTRLEGAIAALVKTLDAQGGVSAILYGSAARGDWVAGRSDVNLMLVVDDATPEGLRRYAPAVAAWHQAGFTPPLLIGREEWSRAADVFPVEIIDMRAAHRLLLGPDPLAGLTVKPEDLRQALETAYRGKLLRLRQAYVRFADEPIILGGFTAASISELLVLFRATAVLLGRQAGSGPEDTIASLEDLPGIDGQALRDVLPHRGDGQWGCPRETFVRYLESVRTIAELVDQYSTGAG